MRTVWLASYPKSGNTWLRMLVANLLSEDGNTADINDLPERGGIASAREVFDHLTLLESGVMRFDEIDALRPAVHAMLAHGADDDVRDEAAATPPVRFIKTHDAYGYVGEGEPLLAGARGAHGAILIVRDPRDVASSLANHLGADLDTAIAFLNDATSAFCDQPARQVSQLRQSLLDWSGFQQSWLEQRDIPVHLTRYEDLKADPLGAFSAALAFARREASAAVIERAIALADFAELQRMEAETGFREAPRSGASFFRRGEAGAWREELTAGQAERITAAHARMMLRLGYRDVAGPGSKTSHLSHSLPQ